MRICMWQGVQWLVAQQAYDIKQHWINIISTNFISNDVDKMLFLRHMHAVKSPKIPPCRWIHFQSTLQIQKVVYTCAGSNVSGEETYPNISYFRGYQKCCRHHLGPVNFNYVHSSLLMYIFAKSINQSWFFESGPKIYDGSLPH